MLFGSGSYIYGCSENVWGVRYKYLQNVESNVRSLVISSPVHYWSTTTNSFCKKKKKKIDSYPEELDARDFVDSFDHGYMQRESQIYA